MNIINLRKHYPHYTEDIFIEVSDEVYEVILLSIRQENNYKGRMCYHKAQQAKRVYDRYINQKKNVDIARSESVYGLLQDKALSVDLKICENIMPKTVGNFMRSFIMNNNQKQIAPLETITANTLMNTEYTPLAFSIEKLLSQGIFFLQAVAKSANHGLP